MAPSRCCCAAVMALSLSLVSLGAGQTLSALRVDSLDSPLGTTTAAPILSWRFDVYAASPRNVTQYGYQILVCSTQQRAWSGTGDVWDSGFTVSPISHAALGASLLPGQAYWWTVRAWTGDLPDPTSYATPQRFSVGLLTRGSWSASSAFLGMASADDHAAPWLRTTFNLTQGDIDAVAANASALLHVASVGYHEAFVNGARLENGSMLLPSVSDLSLRVLSHTYDVATYLRVGENALGLWIAPGWALFKGVNPVMSFNLTKCPLVMAELRLWSPGQLSPYVTVRTDLMSTQWKASLSSVSHVGAWQNSDFGGDALDWRRNVQGWSEPAFDDSAWENATAYDLEREVSPESLEPTGVIGRVPVAAVEPCGDAAPGCYRVTMADLFTGVLDITALSATGQLNISYSTNANTAMEFNMMDVIIPKPGTPPPTLFRGRFSYHEIHYVTITGLDAPPLPRDINGLRLGNMRERVGSFNSSNVVLNGVYDAMVRTYEGLTTGGMSVDCPHRERLGYGGDAHTHMEFALATYPSLAFYSKWARDWRDTQGWEGTDDLPHTSTFDGGGGPSWGGFVVTMPWQVYVTTGDRRILSDNVEMMQRFIGFLLSNVNATSGLLMPFGGSWGFLGDWVTPHGSETSGTVEASLFNNCYLVYILRLTAQINAVLGNATGAAYFNSTAAVIAGAVHVTYYRGGPATHSYLDTRQTHQVMPLIAGVVPAAIVASVLTTLETEITVTQKGHVDTGLHGTYFMAKLLGDADVGRTDLLVSMALQPTAPSYAALLAAGYTTWPEEWAGAPSRMHGCLNGFGMMFSQSILGVRPDPTAPGFRRFTVRPAYGVGGMTAASGVTVTPLGPITTGWSVGNSNYTLALTVPGNTAAVLWIPAVDAGAVMEGGRPAASASGVVFVGMDGDSTMWRVGSGVYAFTSYV